MKPYVIFDLDGTLADCEHRVKHVRDGNRNWAAFHAGIPDDGVMEPVAMIYRTMVANPDMRVFLLTGRNESDREITENWLYKHKLTGYDALHMKQKPHMKDTEQKGAVLDMLVHTYGQMPVAVFEDRPRVVKMWNERGVFVFDVAQGATE